VAAESMTSQSQAAVRPLSAMRFDRRQLALLCALFGLAVVAWILTDDRMAGMDEGPGTALGTLGFYVTVWVVMMAAMMFPSAAPTIIVYARLQAHRRTQGRRVTPAAAGVFAAGYLVAWAAFGVAAYLLFALVDSLSIGVLDWDRAGRYLAGAVIFAAALYELTPAKDVCLSKCRGPLDFLMGGWRDGYGGALSMGLRHGAWCVGCCWALMAALFALGVMSIGWMVFVSALIAAEKLLPWKAVATRSVALLLVVLGIAVAAAPDRVPGLTVPDSGHGPAMPSMQMDAH
jgi:predicted metal-binding membrane protein